MAAHVTCGQTDRHDKCNKELYFLNFLCEKHTHQKGNVYLLIYLFHHVCVCVHVCVFYFFRYLLIKVLKKSTDI
jgi:hypothetical protein